MDRTLTEPVPDRPIGLFDDRYGVGAFERMMAMLKQPCVSFAAIATQFGVTRERVRQWHALYLPGAPSGLERRTLCRLHQSRQRMFEDEAFRTFYRQARDRFGADQIGLIRTRDGLRQRTVQIRGQLVIIRKARHQNERDGARSSYVLSVPRRGADFVYFQLDGSNFLFVPKPLLPAAGTTYADSSRSKYQPYRNTFAALPGTDAAPLAE